jgi:hypothetical protein
VDDIEYAARARRYHDLALTMDGLGCPRAAELFHRRAGLLLARVPLGGPWDRERVTWAVSLAANLRAQHRPDEERGVLVAALALAEGCLGIDDPDTEVLRLRLARREPPGPEDDGEAGP